METRMNDKRVNYSHKPNKPNNNLVSVWLEHFRCIDEPQAYTNSQDSPWLRLQGEATTFPLIVFFVFGHGAYTQMSLCFATPKLGILKFSKLGLLQLWRPIIFYSDLRLRWNLKQSCIFRQNHFNDMWHATYT
jgi:hypothetical protein